MHGIFVMIEYHGLQIEKYGLILNTTDTACHKEMSRRIRSVDMTRFAVFQIANPDTQPCRIAYSPRRNLSSLRSSEMTKFTFISPCVSGTGSNRNTPCGIEIFCLVQQQLYCIVFRYRAGVKSLSLYPVRGTAHNSGHREQ